MKSAFMQGLQFHVSDFFPEVFASEAGIIIAVDRRLSVETLCRSPLGRLLVDLGPDAWILDTNWARQQVPLGVWGLRIPDKPVPPVPVGQCIAPMALIVFTELALHLTGHPGLLARSCSMPGLNAVSDYQFVKHYQHTNGRDAMVYCYWGPHKLAIGVQSLEQTSIPPLVPLCSSMPVSGESA